MNVKFRCLVLYAFPSFFARVTCRSSVSLRIYYLEIRIRGRWPSILAHLYPSNPSLCYLSLLYKIKKMQLNFTHICILDPLTAINSLLTNWKSLKVIKLIQSDRLDRSSFLDFLFIHFQLRKSRHQFLLICDLSGGPFSLRFVV